MYEEKAPTDSMDYTGAGPAWGRLGRERMRAVPRRWGMCGTHQSYEMPLERDLFFPFKISMRRLLIAASSGTAETWRSRA